MSYATTTAIPSDRPEVRKIGISDLLEVLRQGKDDFLAIPTQLIFLCLLYPVVGMIAARAAVGDLLPLLVPLLAGLSLMGPVLAVGLYELSKRREAGLPVSWLNAFDVLRSPAILSITAMGAMLFAIFVVWVACARGIYELTLGAMRPDGIGALANEVLHTGAGLRLAVFGDLAGLVFAIMVITVSVVSIPMLLDRNCGIALAVGTSVRVVARNPVTMAVWGTIVAAMLLLGSIPLFIGLAVTMPIVGHATWHLYRRVVA